MDSSGVTSPYKDRWDADGDGRSPRSTKRDSPESLRRREDENEDGGAEKNRSWHSDSERGQLSEDGGRSPPSFYSDDYDSPSGGPKSPYSQSTLSSHSPHRRKQAKTTSSTPITRKGYVGRPGAYRQEHLQAQQHHKGARSQTKDYAPCKDLDVATKRLLSSRLLKINQLKSAFAELQQQYENIQVENRTLRQVQARLQHHHDTEGQVARLMSRHASESRAYQERLRRCQEQVRALERRLKDKEEQLQEEQAQLKKSRAATARLKRLLARDDLETRDELSRKLEEEKSRAQAAEEKMKEVEHSKELSNNLYQRQLAAERRKTVGVQEENQTLQQMLEELTRKLRKKERELDAMNIYANRVVKSSARKDPESVSKQKVSSRNSMKAAEPTRRTCTPDFPTPPPAVADEPAEQALDEYLSLKNLHRGDKPPKTDPRNENREEQEGEDKGKDEPQKQRLEKEEKEPRRAEEEEEEDQIRPGHVQQQDTYRNQEASVSRDGAELRRKKDQLLAKMREIDDQNQVRRQAPLETEDLSADAGGREGRRGGGMESPARGAGRRALRPPSPGEDLLFGNYAPSFGNPSSRRSLNFPAAPPSEKRDTALETVSLLHSRGAEAERKKVEEDKKSNFLQRLFGPIAVADSRGVFDHTEVHSPPPASSGPRSTRERPFSFNNPEATASTAHTRPAIRASFEADIEEITL